jgi:hypothetical protein
MLVTAPPTTFDPVGSAAHDKANVAHLAQSAGTEQSKLQLPGARALRGRGRATRV